VTLRAVAALLLTGLMVGAALLGAAAPTASARLTTIVEMRRSYVPDSVVIRPGDRVVWVNTDRVPHTASKDHGPGGRFDSGPIFPGESYTRTFKRPGLVRLSCRIHPRARMTVRIRPSRRKSRTTRDGARHPAVRTALPGRLRPTRARFAASKRPVDGVRTDSLAAAEAE
jgi:plastocyanin